MRDERWESYSSAGGWDRIESSNGEEIKAKSNYYYPLDPLYYADLVRKNEKKLVSVEIWPNNNCNQKCIFCNSDTYNLKGRESLPFDVLSTLINDLADMGNKVVRISGGGEPFLYERMPEIIELIAKRNMASCFVTNGSALNDKLIELLSCFSSIIRFSFAGGSRADYLSVHGRDHFDKVIKNMQKMVRKRAEVDRDNPLSIGATFIVTPQNLTSVLDAVKLARDCGLDYILMRPPSPTNFLFAGNDRDILARQLEASHSLESDIFYVSGEIDKFDGTRLKVGLRRACYVSNFRTYITCDGNVSSCFDGICNRKNSFGNVKRERFKDIWGGEAHLALRRRVGQGKFFEFCHRHCANDDFNRTIDEMKRAVESDPSVKFKKVYNKWAKKFAPKEEYAWF